MFLQKIRLSNVSKSCKSISESLRPRTISVSVEKFRLVFVNLWKRQIEKSHILSQFCELLIDQMLNNIQFLFLFVVILANCVPSFIRPGVKGGWFSVWLVLGWPAIDRLAITMARGRNEMQLVILGYWSIHGSEKLASTNA